MFYRNENILTKAAEVCSCFIQCHIAMYSNVHATVCRYTVVLCCSLSMLLSLTCTTASLAV